MFDGYREEYRRQLLLLCKQCKQNVNNRPDEQKSVYKTIGGTPHLDGGYTVFGEVLDGFYVIDQIAAVKTGRGDVPLTTITMSIEVLE